MEYVISWRDGWRNFVQTKMPVSTGNISFVFSRLFRQAPFSFSRGFLLRNFRPFASFLPHQTVLFFPFNCLFENAHSCFLISSSPTFPPSLFPPSYFPTFPFFHLPISHLPIFPPSYFPTFLFSNIPILEIVHNHLLSRKFPRFSVKLHSLRGISVLGEYRSHPEARRYFDNYEIPSCESLKSLIRQLYEAAIL